MKITTSSFDYNYHNSIIAGNRPHGFYVLHNIDVFNTIRVDDVELSAVYQTGIDYYYNDYDCPSPNLSLSENADTSDVLIILNNLVESDFENDEYINERLEEVQELCQVINSVDKLLDVYHALNDNVPILAEFLDTDIYTDNIDDYIKDEESGNIIPYSESA